MVSVAQSAMPDAYSARSAAVLAAAVAACCDVPAPCRLPPALSCFQVGRDGWKAKPFQLYVLRPVREQVKTARRFSCP